MKAVIAACFLMFAVPALAAHSPPSASQIIHKEGRLVFTDGSSSYDFEKNGTFHSAPLGQSGRTIEGHWKQQFDSFVIQGTWGWVNGGSAANDYREMTLSVYPIAVEPKKSGREVMMWLAPGVVKRTYRCYFVVEELIKLPKPKKEQPYVRASAVSRPIVYGL